MATLHAIEGVDSYSAICELFNVPLLAEGTDDNVSSELPVLILNGYLDPATPTFRSEEVAETLPNSFSFMFPYGTHVQARPETTCSTLIMAQFIEDPTTEPDASCIDESFPISFRLPEPTVADVLGEPLVFDQYYIDGELGQFDDGQGNTLVVSEDTLSIQTDCNTVEVSYVRDDLDMLTIDWGDFTPEDCGEDSYDSKIFQLLPNAERMLIVRQYEGTGFTVLFMSTDIGSVGFSTK